jgi:hypothetical protein
LPHRYQPSASRFPLKLGIVQRAIDQVGEDLRLAAVPLPTVGLVRMSMYGFPSGFGLTTPYPVAWEYLFSPPSSV